MKHRFSGRSLSLVVVGATAILLLQVTGAFGVTERVVRITNLRYQPATVRVAEGGMVSWKNDDTVAHTVTADEGGFDTGTIQPGATSIPLTFLATGRYRYHCSVLPEMTGVVVVQAASDGASPSASPSFPSTDALLGTTSSGGSGGGTAIALIGMLVLAAAGGWWTLRSTRAMQPAFALATAGTGRRAGRRERARPLRPVSDLAMQRNISMLHSLHAAGGWESVEQAFRISAADPSTVEAVREFLAEQEDWRSWEHRPRRRFLPRPH